MKRRTFLLALSSLTGCVIPWHELSTSTAPPEAWHTRIARADGSLVRLGVNTSPPEHRPLLDHATADGSPGFRRTYGRFGTGQQGFTAGCELSNGSNFVASGHIRSTTIAAASLTSAGDVTWARELPLPQMMMTKPVVVPAGAGAVVATGFVTAKDQHALAVTRIDAKGRFMWARTVEGALPLALAWSDEVGATVLGAPRDFKKHLGVLLRISSDGALESASGIASEDVRSSWREPAIAALPNGDVAVLTHAPRHADPHGVLIARFNRAGEAIWGTRLTRPPPRDEEEEEQDRSFEQMAQGFAVRPDGSLAVALRHPRDEGDLQAYVLVDVAADDGSVRAQRTVRVAAWEIVSVRMRGDRVILRRTEPGACHASFEASAAAPSGCELYTDLSTLPTTRDAIRTEPLQLGIGEFSTDARDVTRELDATWRS